MSTWSEFKAGFKPYKKKIEREGELAYAAGREIAASVYDKTERGIDEYSDKGAASVGRAVRGSGKTSENIRKGTTSLFHAITPNKRKQQRFKYKPSKKPLLHAPSKEQPFYGW